MTLRVFVADDSITIQKIVTLAFAGEDVAIEAVSNGDAALEALRRFNPDIVLADVFMPGCNGYEVCAHIKDASDLQHIPVILLVGAFETFDTTEASRVRCDGHLTKPFDTAELIQTIRAHVGDKLSCTVPTESAKPNFTKLRITVSPATMASFVGEAKILELLDPGIAAIGEANGRSENPTVQPVLSEDALNYIVDKVIRKMSAEVIRDVAWEVVPELSETIIRQTLKDPKLNR
jgi:CheY-like chemotaxis protein